MRRVFFFSIFFLLHPITAFPLSTRQRWIVDESTGHRTKLGCVNWASHMEPMVAEGLSKQPLDTISKSIASMGFNCVRLTWPVYLFADHDSFVSTITVGQSFRKLGLTEDIAAIRAKNPHLVNLTLVQAYKAVVSNLAKNNIMVILDNHVSKPQWCCSGKDGNGFFGDEYFNPDEWIKGLTRVATMFNGFTNVVGMSLRNELRGPRENVDGWFRYMQMGAETVHSANPNVLIILSGLHYDTILDFLRTRSFDGQTFKPKLVFEMHWYGFVGGNVWSTGNPNDVCGSVLRNVKRNALFLLEEQGWPMFVSEWGADQRGSNANDNRYLGCIVATLADLDLDWAIWALQGSYYIRQGVRDADEVYGMLTFDWSKPRSRSFLRRIAALRSPFQGPHTSKLYSILFYPSTGQCVVTGTSGGAPFRLGPCSRATAWTYSTAQRFELFGSSLCLKVSGEGKRVYLGHRCTDSSSTWDFVSDSKMHISSSRATLCLDVDSDGSSIVTNQCRCLISKNSTCDPESQWFKMIKSGAN